MLYGANVWGPGKVRSARQFTGASNSYVQVPDNSTLDFGTGDFSLDTWLKLSPSASYGSTMTIVKKEGTLAGYTFYLVNREIWLKIAVPTGPSTGTYMLYASGIVVPIDNQWSHVAVTVDRDQPAGLRFYLMAPLPG